MYTCTSFLPDYPHQDKRAYYHECFLRGRPELARLMTRLCNPGKRLPDKNGEPDFYEISRKYPLPELPNIPGCIHPSEQQNEGGDAFYAAMRSPSAAAAAAANSQNVQRILFASPPIHHASAGANINRNTQRGAPQPMYFPAGGGGPMEQFPAAFHQQSPFGFYAPPQFMMPPPQSMPGGPPGGGYYVVYQPPPMFMQAPPPPHASSATAVASLPYAAASSSVVGGGQPPDMAALLAATALTSAAGMGRDVHPLVGSVAEGEVHGKTSSASQEDDGAKPGPRSGAGATVVEQEDEKVKKEEDVTGNSTAEV